MYKKLVFSLLFLLLVFSPNRIYAYTSHSLKNEGTLLPSLAVALENGTATTTEISINGTIANVTATAIIGTQDYVDNNVSDVDSSDDKGTHSNFTEQQYGPDSVYDTITEEGNILNISYKNSSESYSAVGQSAHNFNYTLQKDSGNYRLVVVTVSWEDAEASAYISSLTFNGTAMTNITEVTVGTGYSEYISLWYLLDSSLPNSQGSYNIAVTVSEAITREIYIAVSEYSGVNQAAPDDYDTNANTSPGNTAITLTATADDSLVIAGVGEGGTNALTNTNNITNIQEQVLTSSGSALGHNTSVVSGDLTIGWNNLDTREGMAGAVWRPGINYTLDLEVQWTSVDYDEDNEYLCIFTGSLTSENLTVDIRTGSSWTTGISTLQSNQWNNVSVSSYLTGSTFTIRFKGGNESSDVTQDNWKIDVSLLHIWTNGSTYDYVLSAMSQKNYHQNISLNLYDSTNIERLSNCTVWFHDSTTSIQIEIIDGSIISSTGDWYNLTAFGESRIALYAEESNSGTSILYIKLEAVKGNSIIYENLIKMIIN